MEYHIYTKRTRFVVLLLDFTYDVEIYEDKICAKCQNKRNEKEKKKGSKYSTDDLYITIMAHSRGNNLWNLQTTCAKKGRVKRQKLN